MNIMKRSRTFTGVKLKDKSTAEENGEYEFACDEGMYRSPQKRKQNALDY